MSEEVQPGFRVPSRVYERFRAAVRQAHGTEYGNMGRVAETLMEEYSDDILNGSSDPQPPGGLPSLSQNGAKKQKQSYQFSNETREKAEAIVQRLASDGTPVTSADDVERAIDEIAGSSGPTYKKYKVYLPRHRLAAPDPRSDDGNLSGEYTRWYVDMDYYVEQMADAAPAVEAAAAAQVGNDWFDERAEKLSAPEDGPLTPQAAADGGPEQS